MASLGGVAAAVSLFDVIKKPIPVVCSGLALFLMGSFIIRGVLTYRVTLTADYAEVNNGLPFGTRRMLRKDIAAKHIDRSYLLLYPNDKKMRPLGVGMTVRQDEYFRQWMAEVPWANPEFFKQRGRK